MKITRRQLRKLILKEFLNIGDQQFSIKDFDRLGSDSGGGSLPPVEPPRGGGGGGGGLTPCEADAGGKFTRAYRFVLNAFSDYIYKKDIDESEYLDFISMKDETGVTAQEIEYYKNDFEFLSDNLLYGIAMAVCKGIIPVESIDDAFENPYGYY
jgi:hypothetical protein